MPWILRLLIYVTCFFILEFYFFKKLFNSIRILFPNALKPRHKRYIVIFIVLLNLFPITQFVNWSFELLFDIEILDFGYSFLENYLIHYPFWINILIVLQSAILLLPVDLLRLILSPFTGKYREKFKTWNARLILLVYIIFTVYVPVRIFYDINFVEVRHTAYNTAELHESLEGLKIGLIADIQADYYTDESRLDNYITKLNDEVRIVTLEAMRVASTRTISVQPESDGWNKLKPWATKKGIFDDEENHPIFGFDNPGPHEKDEANRYGYEHWIKVDNSTVVDGEFTIREIPAQKYAVLRCKGVENIGKKWKELVSWRSRSKYEHECANCVEKIVDRNAMGPDDLILDLYLPIKIKSM